MSFQSVLRSHLARRDPRHIDLVPHRSQSAWTSIRLLSSGGVESCFALLLTSHARLVKDFVKKKQMKSWNFEEMLIQSHNNSTSE